MIGNVDGVLAVFKGDKSGKPWKKCSGLGTVRPFMFKPLQISSARMILFLIASCTWKRQISEVILYANEHSRIQNKKCAQMFIIRIPEVRL